MDKDSKGAKTGSSKGSIGLKTTLAEADLGKGKVSVSAGISIDISPVDVDISLKDNSLGVKGEIGLPGDVVSVGGGVTIDLDTGKVIGGSASASAAGATVEVSQVECERSISVSYFGISVGYSEDICINDDDHPGGAEEDEDSLPPPPGIPPQPNFGAMIPPGYGGSVCPNWEYQWQRVYTGMYKGTEEDWSPWAEGSYKICISIDTYTSAGWGPGWMTDKIRAEMNQKSRWMNEAGDLDMPVSEGFPWRLISSDSGDYKNKRVYVHGAWSYREATGSCTINGGGWYVGIGGPFLTNIPAEKKFCKSTAFMPRFTQRRPIPPEKDMNECCDASISLLRKISKVLAVDEVLKPYEITGKQLNAFEKTMGDILDDKPDQKIRLDDYLKLNMFLGIVNNRKVAQAVGVDVLEFEKDEKNPIFHYLRWLKEYSEGITGLDYEKWLTDKTGLIVSKTQFKSIIEVINAELNNSKVTAKALRADDLIKIGMEVPNELFAPEGVGFTIANDYPNILKKIIQILDLNTVSPFTAVLQDQNPAKEGNQTLTKYYPDATSACKEIIELLLENKVDSATRLNVLIRQSILATQQQVAMLETLSIAYTIMNGLGLPHHQKGNHFVAPFDISPNSPKEKNINKKGGGKGFNPKDKEEEARVQSAMNALNENREGATEKLLPDFLATVNQEYLHTYFDDKNRSLWYYIMSVFMKS